MTAKLREECDHAEGLSAQDIPLDTVRLSYHLVLIKANSMRGGGLVINEFFLRGKSLDAVECPKCKKSCKNLYILKQHQEFVHEPTSCPVCKKTYKGLRVVQQHLKRYGPTHKATKKKTGGNTESKSLILATCPLCERVFRNWFRVKRHQQRVHEKKYIYRIKST